MMSHGGYVGDNFFCFEGQVSKDGIVVTGAYREGIIQRIGYKRIFRLAYIIAGRDREGRENIRLAIGFVKTPDLDLQSAFGEKGDWRRASCTQESKSTGAWENPGVGAVDAASALKAVVGQPRKNKKSIPSKMRGKQENILKICGFFFGGSAVVVSI
jgi:hypothetical protein